MSAGKELGESEAKKLYERLVELEAQTHASNEQLQAIQEQLGHLKHTVQAVEELRKLKKPQETWIPIAPGAYVKGSIDPAATVLLAIGSGTAAEKSAEEVIATLSQHVATLDELSEGALAELKENYEKMQKIKERVENSPVPGNPAHSDEGHVHGPDCEHHHTSKRG